MMEDNIVLFGAGNFAEIAIQLIGADNIQFIVDNNQNKAGTELYNIPIFWYFDKIQELKKGDYHIVISVSDMYEEEIKLQLRFDGIIEVDTLSNIRYEKRKRVCLSYQSNIERYTAAVNWIKNNSIVDKGIIVNSLNRISYPEVTGYFIPTLIRWGYREYAIGYAKWLMSIQREDGSWTEPSLKYSYVFDSAQILKGLIAIREILPEVDVSILKGCDWIISNVNDEGRLITPTETMWGDKSTCSELVHIYCISPLLDAAKIYKRSDYEENAYKVLNYYKRNFEHDIKHFSLLSHFYAYIVEGLLDIGEYEWAKEAMYNIEVYQKTGGEVPAYNDVSWVCSTGLFQLSLIWFRLGNIERGNKAFEYACKLQNETGGWYGSYISEENVNEKNDYFPLAEISWANKYFLDALYYKNRAEFDFQASSFLLKINKEDGRYDTVKKYITDKGIKVLDVGCGKGRYLRNLCEDFPNNKYYGVDISKEVLKYLKDLKVEYGEGTLTDIPYRDKTFDVTYTCEALEYAIDLNSAIREMSRVTASGGIIIVVDKNDGVLGELEISEWEQWPNEDKLKEIMMEYCSEVTVKHGLEYEDGNNKDLFTAWIGRVK